MNTNYPDNLKILYPKQEIEAAVIRLAAEITREYQARNPLILGVLKGSFIFMSDLVRRLEFPLETDFVQLSSYSRGTQPGRPTLVRSRRSKTRALTASGTLITCSSRQATLPGRASRP